MRMSLPLDRQCQLLGLPVPVGEFIFHPVRKWRLDHAWPDRKLAVEVQGGIFSHGRHVRGAAMLKEFEKLNTAAAMGWRFLYFTPGQIADGSAMPVIESALKGL